MNSGVNRKIPRGPVKRRRTQSEFIKRMKVPSEGSQGLIKDLKQVGVKKEINENYRAGCKVGILRDEDYTNSSTPFGDERDFSCDKDVNMDVILAKEAFYDLRLEARNYLKTTKRLVRNKEVFCEETRKIFSYSLVESMKQPIQEMSCQLNFINLHIQPLDKTDSRDNSFQEEIQRLEHNFTKLRKRQELKLESESVSQSCTSCEIF